MSNIAVLIPTFEPKTYFERCLLSLEKQTISKDKFCVYIALNGSKYPFEDYIFNLLSNTNLNFKYFYIQQSGVSNARNKLIEASLEEFIVFIDDDDLVSENYLENLFDVSSEEFIGVSNIKNFEMNIDKLKENYIGRCFDKLSNQEVSRFKIRKYFSSPVAKMINRNMIENVKFDNKLSIGEDALFMATISKNIKGVKKSLNDTFYYVYEREGSSTRKKINLKEKINRSFYLINEYLKLLVKKDYDKVFIVSRIIAVMKNLILK